MTTLACAPPLAAKVRREADGGHTLWMVNSGATLLEGDELHISLRLRAGARLAVHSVAAQLVHPCLDGGWASLSIDADVEDDAVLFWQPEPVIVAAGALFRSRANVSCGADAGLRWVDELVLGRSGEDPADLALDTSVRIDVDGAPRWRDGLCTAAGWRGPAVLGNARYVASEIELGAPFDKEPPTRDAEADIASRNGADATAARPTDRATHQPDPWSSGWLTLAGGGRTRRTLATDPLAGRPLLHGYP